MAITATAGEVSAAIEPRRPSWADMYKHYPAKEMDIKTLYDKIGGGLKGFDFEPGDGEGDIVRFGYPAKNSDKETIFKCGFYRTEKFRVLVPPTYDECDAFNDGSALVCTRCTSHCDSGDCHESDITGDEGLVINEKTKS